MNARSVMFSCLVAVFGVTTVDTASATCTGRIDLDASNCLSASWTNPDYGSNDRASYTLTRSCAGYPGKIVALVEANTAGDSKTVGFTGDSNSGKITRRGSTIAQTRITGVKCCGNQGVCQPADAVTDASCLAQWNESDASESCWDANVTEAGSSGTKCRIETTCNNNLDSQGNDQVRTVEFLDVDDLTVNSRGYIQTP